MLTRRFSLDCMGIYGSILVPASFISVHTHPTYRYITLNQRSQMCNWIVATFEDCDVPSHHWQLGIKCSVARENEKWCETEEMELLNTDFPTTFKEIKITCPYCHDYYYRYVDRP